MFVFAEDSLRLLAVNDAMARQYGWSRAELLGKTVPDLWVPQEAARLKADLANPRGSRAAFVREGVHQRKDGSWFDAETTVSRLKYEGRDAGLAMVNDTSARQRAERALEQERTLLRTVVDHLPEAVFVKDLQHRFVTANRATARLMGARSPDDLTGRTDADFYPPGQAEEYRADEQRILATGRPLVGKDEPHVDPDGNHRSLLITKVPLRDPEGKVVGLVGSSLDITERKRAEDALRQSEERLRALFEETGAAMILIDPATGAINDANPAAAAFYGYSRRHLRSMRIDQINQLPAEEIAAERQRAVERIQNRFVFPHRLANGEGRLVEVFSSPVTIQGRLMLFSIILDITERKRLEEVLRANEQRYRIVADFTYDWEFWLGPDGRHRYLSPSAERIAGRRISLDTPAKETLQQIVHPEDRARRLEHLRVELADHPPCEQEYRIVRPDGEVRWIHHVCRAIHDDQGRFLGTRGSNRDITERKRAEEALRESNERFRLFMDNSPNIAWVKNEAGRIVYLSRTFEKRFGVRLEDWRGKADAELWPRETARSFRKVDQAVLAADRAIELVDETPNPDGTRCYWLVSKFPFRDGSGSRFVGGIGLDITERRRAEAALRQLNATLEQQVLDRTRALAEGEQHLRAIVDTAADGILTLDEAGRIESMNPAALRLFGYRADEIIGQDITRLLPVTGKGGAAGFLAHHQQSVNHDVPGHPHEVSGRSRSGSLLLLELILTPFPRGERPGFVALLHDIRQRKRLERELVEVSERERQQVGRELHDELGQILHGVHFLASDLEVRLRRQGVAEAAELSRLTHFLDEALSTTRNLARGLQPVPPVPEGLMKALHELALRIRKVYGLSCRFLCPQPVLIEDPAVATHLFRIAQEAVNNAVRHARCKRIRIRLKATPERLLLGIQDDGHVRFPALNRRPGMGLHVMQFRASAVNGSLVVQRRAGGGTEVVCTVEPCSPETHQDSNGTPAERGNS
ncbi:MAG: PAS domain S-box protein [Verrucomicrobia bacterium]|nr:PAS domain S-box protein [Verrucomicrobiota bacterium]